MSKKSNGNSANPGRYTSSRPVYAPSVEQGKSFAYYDKEPRTGHPWDEPAQRQIIIKDEGRFKRVYSDGTFAEGHISPTALKKSVEIGGIAATDSVEVIDQDVTEEDRIKAAEELGLYGQDLDDYLGQSSEGASAAEAA